MLRIHDHMANDALEGLFVTISWLHNKIKTLELPLKSKISILKLKRVLGVIIQVREFKKRMKNHIQIYMNLNCTFTFIENMYAFPPEDETTFDLSKLTMFGRKQQ